MDLIGFSNYTFPLFTSENGQPSVAKVLRRTLETPGNGGVESVSLDMQRLLISTDQRSGRNIHAMALSTLDIPVLCLDRQDNS
jgi:hypothetical protein